MATTTYIGLETHGDGTVGLNGIIEANWERLDEVFDPGLSSSDPAHHAIWQAFVRSATDPATQGASIEWDDTANKPVWRASIEAVAYATPLALSCTGARMQTISLTGNLTFSSLTSQAAGRRITVLLSSDGSSRTLGFPAGWVFVGGSAPASIAANKEAVLELWCVGAADADVRARYSVEP